MRALLTCAACLLASASGAAAEDGDALHLLQTSSAKISLHSEPSKECKAAKRADRDAKKNLKTNRVAFKEARAALKALQETKKVEEEARAAAQAQIAALCPLPEVDMSPDVGSSGTLVTTYIPWSGLDLLARVPRANWYGFDKVVPGGGVPEGDGPMGRAIGIQTMQPCSVAWTVGEPVFPMGSGLPGGQSRNPVNGQTYQAFYQSPGLTMESPAKCREWADTKIKFPQAGAVMFQGREAGTPGYCRVYTLQSPEELPWQNQGFDLQLRRVTGNAGNAKFSCYLGNPEEWKQRLKAARAAGQVIDKCSKTSLWSSGRLEAQEKRGQFPSKWYAITVGSISQPSPKPSTQAGRKLCLKWVKADERCDNAIAINLENHHCRCVFNTGGFDVTKRKEVPRSIPNDLQNHIDFQTCIL